MKIPEMKFTGSLGGYEVLYVDGHRRVTLCNVVKVNDHWEVLVGPGSHPRKQFSTRVASAEHSYRMMKREQDDDSLKTQRLDYQLRTYFHTLGAEELIRRLNCQWCRRGFPFADWDVHPSEPWHVTFGDRKQLVAKCDCGNPEAVLAKLVLDHLMRVREEKK